MKRVVLLILALLLLSDLAEDGCLGKATFVAPQSSDKTSLSSPLHDCSGKVDSGDILPSGGKKTPRLTPFLPDVLLVQPTLKIILVCNNGSSGGIPL
jgi:hypothetical protein